jgi:hypothetical protein
MTTPVTPPSADDFLLNGSGPSRKGRSASFLTVGASITGTITEKPTTKQKNDPDTGLPSVWPNGDPVWQIVVPLQTTLRSAEVAATADGGVDDGVRYLYIAGSRKPESKSLHVAVAEAVRAVGAPGLEVGGQLTVTYIGNGPKSPNAPAVAQAPKQYSAVYVAAANALLMGSAPAAAAVMANGTLPQERPTPPVTVPAQAQITIPPSLLQQMGTPLTAPAAAPAPAVELPWPPHLSPEQRAACEAANITAAVAWQMFPAPANA